MTAEEYLNKYCQPEDWNNLEECLKDSILTNNVIEHMERYAALRTHNVVGRSEQFTCDCGFATDDSFKWSVHPLNCPLFDD